MPRVSAAIGMGSGTRSPGSRTRAGSRRSRFPSRRCGSSRGSRRWGFNVERQIKRRQEIDRWTAARQNVWISNLAEAGQLDGLDGVRQGLGLDVRPYGSAAVADGSGDAAGGVDLFKNLTSSVNAAVTVNTDFAETEADLRQVNLTRFPLFFPEKRSFFLEGAGVFDVAGLINTTDLRPFFSRRVGLIDDVAVPVRLGVKLTGRQSDYNVGVLDVETGALTDAGLPGGAVDRQNLLVARVSRNLFQQSWVGGILTHGDPSGSGGNTLIGGDARFATSTFRGNKNLSLDLFLLGTEDGATGARDGAGGFRIDYPERSVGRGAQLAADRRTVSARARLRPAHRDPEDGCVHRVSAPTRALGHPAVLLRSEPGGDHEPAESPGELERVHRALQRADGIRRAPGMELHPDVRAPRSAVRDFAGRRDSARVVPVDEISG